MLYVNSGIMPHIPCGGEGPVTTIVLTLEAAAWPQQQLEHFLSASLL